MFDVKPVTCAKVNCCGPTCLKMLLDYYGIEANLDDLIKECNARLIGCTAADVMRAGRAHGLDMHAYDMDTDELLSTDRPAIIWWRKNHFVIYCGLDDDGNVVICNPIRGRYPLKVGSFSTMYSGNALFNGEPGELE